MTRMTATPSSALASESPSSADGLCSTCNHTPACMYARSTDGPIWRCEEFSDLVAVEAPALVAVSAPAPADTDAPAGLCFNCDERPTCAHLRSAGPVWHCEEYR